jgi:hypothetical protein
MESRSSTIAIVRASNKTWRKRSRGDSWLEFDAGTDVFFMPQRGFVNSAECMDKRD